jgi:hypothetical protein
MADAQDAETVVLTNDDNEVDNVPQNPISMGFMQNPMSMQLTGPAAFAAPSYPYYQNDLPIHDHLAGLVSTYLANSQQQVEQEMMFRRAQMLRDTSGLHLHAMGIPLPQSQMDPQGLPSDDRRIWNLGGSTSAAAAPPLIATYKNIQAHNILNARAAACDGHDSMSILNALSQTNHVPRQPPIMPNALPMASMQPLPPPSRLERMDVNLARHPSDGISSSWKSSEQRDLPGTIITVFHDTAAVEKGQSIGDRKRHRSSEINSLGSAASDEDEIVDSSVDSVPAPTESMKRQRSIDSYDGRQLDVQKEALSWQLKAYSAATNTSAAGGSTWSQNNKLQSDPCHETILREVITSKRAEQIKHSSSHMTDKLQLEIADSAIYGDESKKTESIGSCERYHEQSEHQNYNQVHFPHHQLDQSAAQISAHSSYSVPAAYHCMASETQPVQFEQKSEAPWVCPRSSRENLASKSRCGGCQTWKGTCSIIISIISDPVVSSIFLYACYVQLGLEKVTRTNGEMTC